MSCASARTWVEIDTAAWRANFHDILEHVKPLEMLPVIKANAYGMGDRETAAAFRDAGARHVAVSCLGEGLRLRELGLDVIILGASLPEEIPPLIEAGIIPAVPDFESAELVSRAALAQGRDARVHIKVDTGMGRFGIPLGEAWETIQRIAALPGIELHGIFSHLAMARRRDAFTLGQINGLASLIHDLERAGIRFTYRHIANSIAIAGVREAHSPPFNMVRSGIDLHGGHTSVTQRPYLARPVMTLKARLIALRTMPYGTAIGYGCTYRVSRHEGERIGVVSIGYADGYPRCLSNKGFMLVRGQRCPVVGLICMDYTMLSLSEVPDAAVGDEVVAMGTQGEAAVPLAEVARAAGTIPYELMCGLGARVQRVYR